MFDLVTSGKEQNLQFLKIMHVSFVAN